MDKSRGIRFLAEESVAQAGLMILCDTNVIVEFYKNNPEIIQELQRIGRANLSISVITQAELYFGALNKAELEKIKGHLSLIYQFPIDPIISQNFLQLMESYSLSHKLSIPDALIAATTLNHDLELYTLNTKDFHFIPELKLHNPL